MSKTPPEQTYDYVIAILHYISSWTQDNLNVIVHNCEWIARFPISGQRHCMTPILYCTVSPNA